MSLLSGPTLNTLNSNTDSKRRYTISFAYDFYGDTIAAFQQGSFGGNGSLYDLNLSALNLTNNLPEFRSMRINAIFAPFDATFGTQDGSLSVFNSQTSDLMVLGTPPFSEVANDVNSPLPNNVLSCVVPMSVSPTGIVSFAKSIQSAPSPPYSLSGRIFVTLFSWDVSPTQIQSQSAIGIL